MIARDFHIKVQGKSYRVKGLTPADAAHRFFLEYPNYGKPEEYYPYFGYSYSIFLTLKTSKTLCWMINYASRVHQVYAEGLNQAIAILAQTDYPELGNTAKFITDLHERGRHIEVDLYLRPGANLGKAIGTIHHKENLAHIYGTKGELAMIALRAEMILDEAIRVKRINDLRGLIEESLASGNKELFMQYSAQLNEMGNLYA